MPNILQDVRYGLRMLARRPGVTTAAILSRALGVGANSAVFSLISADRSDVLRLVLKEGLKLAPAGVGLGVLAAPFIGRPIESALYQTDPWSFSTVLLSALALMAAAAVAALVPSLRAAKLDPVTALRED